ncbi:hypothetical protein NPIL_9211 [Nephila pilipes]|uniref:Uncharacterized protein n=1 Tax=Nephila pilipes TaxID=299642 RepID=A0A8X6MFC4_NEPPI|nr:hypothetical protein NPIL_9211 [Nephila pilipes]
MKRKSSSIDVSSERVCFNDDDDDTKVDSSFSDDAVPQHHFHLGQDIYAAVTYFANAVQIHLRQYGRNDNNRLFPTKRGVCMSLCSGNHLPNASSKSMYPPHLISLSL